MSETNTKTQLETADDERARLAWIKAANSQDLWDQGFDKRFENLYEGHDIHVEEMAVVAEPTEDENLQALSVQARISDPSTGAYEYRIIRAADVYGDAVLPIGNTTTEQAMDIAKKASGMVMDKEAGLMPHLAPNLYHIHDLGTGKMSLPPITKK